MQKHSKTLIRARQSLAGSLFPHLEWKNHHGEMECIKQMMESSRKLCTVPVRGRASVDDADMWTVQVGSEIRSRKGRGRPSLGGSLREENSQTEAHMRTRRRTKHFKYRFADHAWWAEARKGKAERKLLIKDCSRSRVSVGLWASPQFMDWVGDVCCNVALVLQPLESGSCSWSFLGCFYHPVEMQFPWHTVMDNTHL